MATRVVKIEIPIETQDKTDPALGKITAKMEDLDSTAKEAQKSMDGAARSASGFEKSLGKSMDNASKKAKGFERSMGDLTKHNWRILLEAKDKITPTVKQAIIYVKSLTSKTWRVTLKALDLVTSPVRRVFGLLKSPLVAAGVTISAGAGIASTVKTYAEFEAAMSQVKAISGATGEEFAQLTEKAKQMGATTKFTVAQSAEAFNYMAMAGWKTSDMMSGIEGIMNLAAASGEDLGTTSDIVTDALTAFGLKASDSLYFADVLAQASASANTNVSKMGQTFQYVAPIAGAMGYKIEDTALAIGLLANAGIKGEKAGTTLRSIFTRLSDPPADAAAAIEKLGLSITNTDGSMRPLNDVMQDLRKNFTGLTQEQKVQMASQLAGQEAMSGLLALVNASEADYNNLAEAIGNAEGASKRMSDTMLDNLSGKWTLFKSALDGVKISLGERFKPYLMDALDFFMDKMPMVEDVLLKGMDKIDNFVDRAKEKISEFTATDEWQNADLFGKMGIAWDELIAEPFSDWWSSTGKVKIAGLAKDLGTGIGTGISAGIMTLLGIDVSSVIDEGSSIGAQFAKGFSEGMSGVDVSSALGMMVNGVFSSAGKLLPGGAAPDIGSLLSVVAISKAAGPLLNAGSGLFQAGKGIYKSAKGGLLKKAIGSFSVADELAGVGIAKGSGLLGIMGKTGMALGSGATTSAGLAAVGGGALAGGIAGGAALISGVLDAYNAYKSYKVGDTEKAKAEATSSAFTLGGVGAGAAAGAAIGSVVPLIGTAAGALIGAGIGGIAGWFGGNKVKKDYEAQILAAEKTKYAIEGAKFETKELQEAFEDTEVSAEEFGAMMQEATSNKIRDSFGDIKLTMQEIEEAAKQIVFADQAEALNKFSAAAETADSSLATLQSSFQTMDKLNWKASLGMELDEGDISEYISTVDAMIESSKQYLEDKHYEATAAIDLLIEPGNETDMTTGLNQMYLNLQSKIESLGGDLKAKVNVALEDGVITLDEQAEITNLQNQIADITNQISQAETEASFQSLKIKYSGASLDADSFASLMTEVQANVKGAVASYDESLNFSLTNLNMQLESGAINQEEFDEQFQALAEGYQAHINDLSVKVESFGLETITDAFGSELDGILPDIEGTMSEKLSTAMHNAMANGIDATEWSMEGEGLKSAIEALDLEGLEASTQSAIAEMMGQVARSLPEQMITAMEGSGADIGKPISTAIETSAENIDVTGVGQVVGTKVGEEVGNIDFSQYTAGFQTNIQNLALEAAESADMGGFSTSLQTNINSSVEGIDYSGVTSSVGTGVSSAIAGAMSTIQGAIDSLYSSVGAAINSAFAAGFQTTTTVTITVDYKLANPSATISFGGGGSGTATVSGSISSNANGGFANGPELTLWGEDGPEVIIPLGGKRRNRGLELWMQAGEILGVHKNASGGFAGWSGVSGIPRIESGIQKNQNDQEPMRYMEDPAEESAAGQDEKEAYHVTSIQEQHAPNKTEISLNMEINPQFVVSGNEGTDVIRTIREHMGELADDMSGAIYQKLKNVFENMPVSSM